MIVVTLGTQKFQMNRLIEAMDNLAANIDEEVFVQRGYSTYEPKYCKYENFLDNEKYKEVIENCSVLLTHSGVGSIMTAITSGKPVVVVPRLAEYGEHVDNHQVEIAEAFARKGYVLTCNNIDELADTIEKARTYKMKPYEVKGGKVEDIILNFMKLF